MTTDAATSLTTQVRRKIGIERRISGVSKDKDNNHTAYNGIHDETSALLTTTKATTTTATRTTRTTPTLAQCSKAAFLKDPGMFLKGKKTLSDGDGDEDVFRVFFDGGAAPGLDGVSCKADKSAAWSGLGAARRFIINAGLVGCIGVCSGSSFDGVIRRDSSIGWILRLDQQSKSIASAAGFDHQDGGGDREFNSGMRKVTAAATRGFGGHPVPIKSGC
ncbi:MAG: hypothetical protein J3R72DRAFT_486746 [Linnemannia gamsii]|nr:MAG: hypothetical protein J3R72DRAFT_486746 [Linnemannia gamsii]